MQESFGAGRVLLAMLWALATLKKGSEELWYGQTNYSRQHYWGSQGGYRWSSGASALQGSSWQVSVLSWFRGFFGNIWIKRKPPTSTWKLSGWTGSKLSKGLSAVWLKQRCHPICPHLSPQLTSLVFFLLPSDNELSEGAPALFALDQLGKSMHDTFFSACFFF